MMDQNLVFSPSAALHLKLIDKKARNTTEAKGVFLPEELVQLANYGRIDFFESFDGPKNEYVMSLSTHIV